MRKTKIALVQMDSILGEIEQNLEKIEEYMEKAYENQVDIISFPEAVITGYSKEARPISRLEKIRLFELFKGWAKDYSMTILAGFIEGNPDGKPYIAHLIADPSRGIDIYRKSHLGESELNHFSPGDRLPIFETDRAKIGVQICWETHFPEISRVMALNGVDIIFTPFASPLGGGRRKDIWMKYLPARAYDNNVFIAASNLINTRDEGTKFGGGLLVLDPKGNILAENFQDEESILYVGLDPELIKKIRDKKSTSMKYRYYMDYRRPELYGDLTKE